MNYIFGSTGETVNRRLKVKIGSSIESLVPANVNTPSDPHFIDSPYFVGNILVRIKGYENEDSEYFKGKKRMFAIQFSGRFKHEYSMDDIIFGSEFEKKIVAPTGSWIAVKFASLIDPCVQVDLFCEKPWFYSPLVCSMNTMRVMSIDTPLIRPLVGNSSTSGTGSTAALNGTTNSNTTTTTSLPYSKAPKSLKDQICPWIWANDELTEDATLLTPDPITDRRKHFQKQKHRTVQKYTTDKVYNFEVFFVD
jgi:hypothetical protein